ncbi:hypothetical protein E4T49_01306 [Aureobasidium sp. EXF-10728]|nr:hypothetical protein E4T49_01306 [Aureobasidium sp. EXF-10728]
MSTNATNTTITTETCQYWMVEGAIPEADSEISGIGAILAFLLSAYFTFAIVLVSYLLGSIDSGLLRPVDLDQQIVTGIAICIAGFIGLHGHISVYHFQTVISLAWMSSSVHLSALTMLGDYFRKRPGVLGWRIIGMLLLFILLLVALVPTASNLWAIWYTAESGKEKERTSWAIPARCFFFKTWGQGVNPDAPLAYLILILSYLWKIGALFKSSRNVFHRRVRGPYEYLLERVLHAEALKATNRREKRKSLSWRYHATMMVYIILLALFEFSASFAASLWLSYVGLVYGTIQLIIPRQQNAWWNNKENSWTFGQIVPLVLLIQPLGAILENYKPRKQRTRSDRDSLSSEEAYELGSGARSTMLSHRDSSDEFQPTFSEMFATLEVLRPSQRSVEVLDHQLPFYNSILFATIIVWIQISIAVISSIVFWIDADSIGYVTSHNYFFVLAGVGCSIGVLILWTMASIPFSRVFK